jgi:hypothetical protein
VEDPDRRPGRPEARADRDRRGRGPGEIGVTPGRSPTTALAGDSADGFPGLPGGARPIGDGARARYEHLDAIPDDDRDVDVRARASLAPTPPPPAAAFRLFLDLATPHARRRGVVDDWEWRGRSRSLKQWPERLGRTVSSAVRRLVEQR